MVLPFCPVEAYTALMSKVTQEQAAVGVAVFGGLMSAFQLPSDGVYLAVLVGITLSLFVGLFWAAMLMTERRCSAD